MALEAQNDDFGLFLHAHEAAPRKGSDPYKTVAGAAKIKVFHISSALHVSKKSGAISLQRSFKQSFPQRSCEKPIGKLAGLGFGRVLGPVGMLGAGYRALLGVS